MLIPNVTKYMYIYEQKQHKTFNSLKHGDFWILMKFGNGVFIGNR